MGILDVISNVFGDNSSGLVCPKCGSDVHEQDVRYYCRNCDVRFILKDGRLLDPFNPLDWDSGRTCINCQSSLAGGDHVIAWEEGNPEPYIICPNCRCHNDRW